MTDQQTLTNAILRDSFYIFAQRAFQEIHPGQEFTPALHVEAICYFLTNVKEGKEKRGIINLPPRHLKSFLISVVFPAWLLGHFPGKKIMCVSYSDDLARELSRMRKKIISSDWYRCAFPSTVIGASKNAENEFETTKRGGCLAVSMNGAITGRGCDLLIIDDPSKADDMRSEAERTHTKDIFENTLSTRLNSTEKGAILLVMQRLSTDDLTAHLLKKGGYRHLSFPAIAEKNEKIQVGAHRYKRRKKGTALQPGRESFKSLTERRNTMPEFLFTSQYQQRPVPAGGLIFKEEAFMRRPEILHIDLFDKIMISVDTANKAGRKSDYTVATIWGLLRNDNYLIDVLRKQLDYPDIKSQILALTRIYPRTTLLIEEEGIAIGLIAELRTMLNVHVIPFKSRGMSKVDRAYRALDALQQGRVILPTQAPWLAAFMQEVMSFPNGDYDDQVDSMTQFLCYRAEQKPRREYIFSPPEQLGGPREPIQW